MKRKTIEDMQKKHDKIIIDCQSGIISTWKRDELFEEMFSEIKKECV